MPFLYKQTAILTLNITNDFVLQQSLTHRAHHDPIPSPSHPIPSSAAATSHVMSCKECNLYGQTLLPHSCGFSKLFHRVVGRTWTTACVWTQWQFLPHSTNTCPAQAANGQPFGLTKMNFSYLWQARHITQACTQFKITCLQWQASSQLVFKQCVHTALDIRLTDCMVTWAALLY